MSPRPPSGSPGASSRCSKPWSSPLMRRSRRAWPNSPRGPIFGLVEIELVKPQTDEEFEQYYRLRYERLRKELGLPEGSERDHPAEPSSEHLVAKVDSRIV